MKKNRVMMMKKLAVSLVLCLLLAAVSSALADTASDQTVDYITYTSPVYGYQIDYPSTWMPLDNDTIDSVIEQISSGEVEIEGFTSAAFDTLKTMLNEDNNTGFVEFIDWEGNNYNVTCFAYPTPPSVEEANETLSPQIIATYRQLFDSLTVLDSGSIYKAGDSEFIKIKCQYVINGQTIVVTSLFYFASGQMVNFCFTNISMDADETIKLEQIMDTVMASFILKP